MRCRQHPLDITVYLRLKKPVFSSLHLRFHGLLLHRHVSGSLVSCQKKDKKKNELCFRNACTRTYYAYVLA